jgi:hypothetical protein
LNDERTAQEIRGEVSVLIRTDAQTLYEYLIDFTRHTEWNANLYRVWRTNEGPPGVGARYRAREGPPPVGLIGQLQMGLFYLVGLVQGTATASESQVMAADPGRRITWSAHLPRRGGDFNRSEWEVLLEPEGELTRVTQRFCYRPQTSTARRMIGSAARIQSACEVNIRSLKTVVESSQVTQTEPGRRG